MIRESRYIKVIRSDRNENIEVFGDVIVSEKVFINGDITANSGSVYIRPGAVVKGNILASINVFIDENALAVGTIKSFSIENCGKIIGIVDANFFKSSGESSGIIKSKMVLLREHAVHKGLIDAICSKIDSEARFLKGDE